MSERNKRKSDAQWKLKNFFGAQKYREETIYIYFFLLLCVPLIVWFKNVLYYCLNLYLRLWIHLSKVELREIRIIECKVCRIKWKFPLKRNRTKSKDWLAIFLFTQTKNGKQEQFKACIWKWNWKYPKHSSTISFYKVDGCVYVLWKENRGMESKWIFAKQQRERSRSLKGVVCFVVAPMRRLQYAFPHIIFLLHF